MYYIVRKLDTSARGTLLEVETVGYPPPPSAVQPRIFPVVRAKDEPRATWMRGEHSKSCFKLALCHEILAIQPVLFFSNRPRKEIELLPNECGTNTLPTGLPW